MIYDQLRSLGFHLYHGEGVLVVCSLETFQNIPQPASMSGCFGQGGVQTRGRRGNEGGEADGAGGGQNVVKRHCHVDDLFLAFRIALEGSARGCPAGLLNKLPGLKESRELSLPGV